MEARAETGRNVTVPGLVWSNLDKLMKGAWHSPPEKHGKRSSAGPLAATPRQRAAPAEIITQHTACTSPSTTHGPDSPGEHSAAVARHRPPPAAPEALGSPVLQSCASRPHRRLANHKPRGTLNPPPCPCFRSKCSSAFACHATTCTCV